MWRQLVIVCMAAALTQGYPSGVPVETHPEICTSMNPSGHNKSAKMSPAPFVIESNVKQQCCKQGDALKVTVKSKKNETEGGTYFEGVFLQARLKGTQEIVGTFKVTDPKLQTLKCGHADSAAGHKGKAHYWEKEFQWTPPQDTDNDVEFVATVVHETDEFWMHVKSDSFKVKTKTSVSGAEYHHAPSILLFTALSLVLAGLF